MRFIEAGARESTSSVVATTALSAGMNMASVSRVIMRDRFGRVEVKSR
jgi:hypothetical protein